MGSRIKWDCYDGKEVTISLLNRFKSAVKTCLKDALDELCAIYRSLWPYRMTCNFRMSHTPKQCKMLEMGVPHFVLHGTAVG